MVSRLPLRRAALAASAAAAGLLLSSCGATAPGVAATVEGERITDEEVDAFAQVLCAIGGLPGTESGTPTKAARFASLEILLSNALTDDITDVEAVDRAGVSSIIQGMAAARDIVTEDLQDTFDEVATEFARAQRAVIDLGRESLVEAGQPGEIPEDAAYAEGSKLLAEYAAEADIEIDPRFGRLNEDGVLEPTDGSLSVPVSDVAVQGAAAEPTEELVGGLPESQKCDSPS